MPGSGHSALAGVCVVEKDTNGDVLVAWSFPRVGDAERAVALSRCGLVVDQKQDGGGGGAAGAAGEAGSAVASAPYVFTRFGGKWMYLLTFPCKLGDASKVTAASVVVWSRVYNPAKYKALLAVLVRAYASAGSPLPLLKAYLSAVTSGAVKGEHGTFDNSAFDDRRAFISPVKPLFEAFGMEAILIWVAMLLKKRVFVFADRVAELLPAVRAFPLVGAWHRCDWSIVRPYMRPTETELDDLKGVYVAGFTDRKAQGLESRYDLFVDLSTRTFSIPEHARAGFAVSTKFHKDLARTFARGADEMNDQQLIKLIATKTKELVDNIRTLRTEHEDGTYVTADELEARKLPAGMSRFLYSVAQAEKMTGGGN